MAEVTDIMGWSDNTIVVNLQGDEPFMSHELISKVALNLVHNPQAGIATFSTSIDSVGDLFDPNIVKVVTNKNNMALYFSRAAIPWDRNIYSDENVEAVSQPCPQRHLGMYAYRLKTLKYVARNQSVAIERQEALEQLRALWLGINIHVESITEMPSHGVDTIADLERVRKEYLQINT